MTWWNWLRNLALRLDALRPVHDHRVAGAAEVAGDLLRPLERRIHRPCPTDRHMWLTGRPADLVEPLDRALQPELNTDQAGDLAEGALQAALGTRAVVADDVHDERVVQFAGRLEAIDQPADLMVGVGHVCGIVLHQPGYRPSWLRPIGRPTRARHWTAESVWFLWE